MGQIVTIDLFGRSYRFKATSDVSRAREIVDTITREVSKVQAGEAGKKSELAELAVMISVALNLANANYDLQKRNDEILASVSKGFSRVLRRLDSNRFPSPKEREGSSLLGG